jgi:hypothetical protein
MQPTGQMAESLAAHGALCDLRGGWLDHVGDVTLELSS